MSTNKCGKAAQARGEVAKLRELLRMSGVKRIKIDRGVKQTNFKRNFSHPTTVPRTKRNGKLENGEVYAVAINLLEAEEDRFVKSKGQSRRHFTDLVSSCTNFRVPWLFNDFHPKTKSDDRSLLNIVRKIASIRRGIKNFKPNTYDYKLTFLHRLVKWMEKAVKRKSYVSYESTNLELLKGSPGDCTELTRFAYAVLRLAGFKPEFILVTKHAFSPRIRYHMAVGVPLDPKKPNMLTQVDLYHKGFLGYSHPEWVRATKHTMLAVEAVTSGFHWSALRNAALKNTGLITRGMLYLVSTIMMLNYKRAIQFDEYFPDAYYNMAGVLYKLGRRDPIVKQLNSRTLELRPSMKEALHLARWLK